MSTQFLPKLSQNYIELLEDNEYYDITVKVGEDPNVKIFRAHMNILCYRSPYFRRALSSNYNVIAHINLPNISPEIFYVILKYIYGGVLSLNEQETLDIFKILFAADELLLQELVNYLQKYLIENKSEWLEQNSQFIYQASFKSSNLLALQQFCANIMAKLPDKVFKSFDLTLLTENALVELIKRDDFQMKEIEVWEFVLKWGHAQNPTLTTDPNTWTDDDFKTMETTLQHCLPLIRFFSLSSKEFSQKVRPYKKLLKPQVYDELLDFYLDPSCVSTDNILLPRRNIINNESIDSKIVNSGIISTISRWIDKVGNINSDELYLPYKFKLLLRGSRDGFTPKKFHKLCDGKLNTVTFIKVEKSEEILGGYNPITWKSSVSCGKTKDSFIFSFKSKKSFKDPIISNVIMSDWAILYNPRCGPQFGADLIIQASSSDEDYSDVRCKINYYKKCIRNAASEFSIEDYEVFQIIK